jgi:RNA polymerase sigma factor (sigma-70 family)
MNYSLDEDQRLRARCIAGDRKACEIFVQRFSDLIYRSVRGTLTIKQVPFNQQDLEDFHNTVFMKLFEERFKKLRQYQGRNGCSLASWIRLLAVRITLNHLRKRGINGIGGQSKQIRLEDLAELKANDMGAWAEMEKAEQWRSLQEGIQDLPPRDRLFVKLHFESELSIQEVARTMRLSIQNAYTVKHRAIQRLKSHVTSRMMDQP